VGYRAVLFCISVWLCLLICDSYQVEICESLEFVDNGVYSSKTDGVWA
jgi:hypothetical protein